MAPTIPTIKLNTGAEMPLVGFGLWKVENDRCAQVVYDAIKEGYRLFDGACDYGNEVEAGRGVKRAIDEGIVKREDLFIVSKLWNSFHDPERVGPICKKQLADWGLDYFDLYLIHFPVAIKYVDPLVRYPPGWFCEGDRVEYAKCSLQETYQAMEKLVEAGLTKAIGVSNYSGALMLDLFAYCKIRPATLQIEHHPYLVQPDLLKLCKEAGVAVTAYSSFGPQSFLDLGMERAAAADVQILWDHPVITKIAKAHGKTVAQVLLRWATQRGLAVIPKTTRLQIMRDNLDIINWDLTDEEIREISSLDRKLKFNDPLNYDINVPCFA